VIESAQNELNPILPNPPAGFIIAPPKPPERFA